jgi:hypothetical protein
MQQYEIKSIFKDTPTDNIDRKTHFNKLIIHTINCEIKNADKAFRFISSTYSK